MIARGRLPGVGRLDLYPVSGCVWIRAARSSSGQGWGPLEPQTRVRISPGLPTLKGLVIPFFSREVLYFYMRLIFFELGNLGILFKEPGRLYEKYLNQNEKCELEAILKKGVNFKNIEDFYKNHIIIDFINYEELTKEELFFINSILIKTVSRSMGNFFITPDYSEFIIFITTNIKKPITDAVREIDRIKLIGSILLLNSIKLPEFPFPINKVIEPINSFFGPTIASYIAFPLLETICKFLSPVLDIDGTLKNNLPPTREHVQFRPVINNLKEILLITEYGLNNNLKSLLTSLDNEINLYKRIKKQRDYLLHGQISNTWESYLLLLLLYLFYISEGYFP